MYTFRPCTYGELQQLIATRHFVLQAWNLVDEGYIDGLEIVENSKGEIIALIYYDVDQKGMCEMNIQDFEVSPRYRRQGHGRKIIQQFLSQHPTSVNLTPLNEDVVLFWMECGFEGDILGMCFYPEEGE